MDKISYALGMNIGRSLRQSGVKDLNVEQFTKGVCDYLAGVAKMDEKESRLILNDYFTKLQQETLETNKTAGKAFLEENGKRPEVVTLPSGLQYEVLVEGKGPKPLATDRVKVHYHGTLINGTVFDSSVQRGEPATFGVTQVIAGWVEALQLMNVGSKWRLFIPHKLAYGAQGAGDLIQPFSTLIFDVELLDIVK